MVDAINRTDMDLRKALFGNIVMSGGSTLTKGSHPGHVGLCWLGSADSQHRLWRPPAQRGSATSCEGYEDQDLCTTRAQIQHLDWGVDSCRSEHIPKGTADPVCRFFFIFFFSFFSFFPSSLLFFSFHFFFTCLPSSPFVVSVLGINFPLEY